MQAGEAAGRIQVRGGRIATRLPGNTVTPPPHTHTHKPALPAQLRALPCTPTHALRRVWRTAAARTDTLVFGGGGGGGALLFCPGVHCAVTVAVNGWCMCGDAGCVSAAAAAAGAPRHPAHQLLGAGCGGRRAGNTAGAGPWCVLACVASTPPPHFADQLRACAGTLQLVASRRFIGGVLQSMDWGAVTFDVISIETHHMPPEVAASTTQLLLTNGYVLDGTVGRNSWYVSVAYERSVKP